MGLSGGRVICGMLRGLYILNASMTAMKDAAVARIESLEPLGATLVEGNACSFVVWAPRAERVSVSIVESKPFEAVMEPTERGYFRAMVKGVSAGALYRYRLDNRKERPDPASRYQPQGVHGPSRIVENHFDWEDSLWEGLPLEEYVIYETHIGTFTPAGTFEAMIPRLARLRELGVTAIEVMPVAQFPGNRNWGYDGVYPYAVQASYGGPPGLKRLVNACHQQGIAVVLDVVYNHLGPEGNYLADFAPYFTDRYKTPWGEAVNFDGGGSDEVRRYFIQNALEWVTDFHIDALRLDAIHAIVDPSARPFLEELGAAVHARAEELEREIFLMPESNRNDARIVEAREAGGLGLDAVWNDDFHHSLHVLLTGERNGYYEDYCGIEDLGKSFREGFVYSGRYSEFRRRSYGISSKQVPAKRFIVFSQNHDQVGNRRDGARPAQTQSLEQLKVAAGTVLLSPYLPMLFMGEEYGETAPFQYFVSHGDAQLVEAVRKGRKEEFTGFGWEGEIPDPQSEETFLRCKLNWEMRAQGRNRALWDFYRELLRLRREVPALAALDKNSMEVETFEEQKVLLVRRWSSSSNTVIACRFDKADGELTVPFPQGQWDKILDSGEERWSGAGSRIAARIESKGEIRLALGPWAFLVFAQSEKA
jgi:maltooligosyltrehalose trehalohydrolase